MRPLRPPFVVATAAVAAAVATPRPASAAAAGAGGDGRLRGDAGNELYAAPLDPAAQPAWLASLKAEREAIRRQINYTGAIYSNPAVNWTRLSFVQPQAHLFDRYLYDPAVGGYTADRFLEDLRSRYGGIDSVLLWPTYTNIGIDARNQFDYFRALPGGLDSLAKLTAEFKARGIRVLWAYNPWDQSTRPEGEPHWKTLAKLLRQTGGDGFNGDTMTSMYREFWTASVDAGYPIVGEMEGGGYPGDGGRAEDQSWETAEWSPMGWGYFDKAQLSSDNITYEYDVAPGVDRFKWLDGRHMTHICDRWAKNRTDTLQLSFFNGGGFESWENVWGVFMHFTQRDGEALRRTATLLRWLGRERFVQDFAEWEPHTADLRRPASSPFSAGGPMASKFVHENGDCAWLLVNRADTPSPAKLSVAGCVGAPSGRRRLFDLYRGKELKDETLGDPGDLVRLTLEAHGYGAVLCTSSSRALPADLPALLKTMRSLTSRPLMSFSADWAPLPQQMVPGGSASAEVSGEGTTRSGTAPEGMVLIPKTAYRFRTAGVEIEGGCDPSQDTWGLCCRQSTRGPSALSCPGDPECEIACAHEGEDSRGVDAQFPWEPSPRRFHDRMLEVGPLFIDRHLVTKADFARFLNASGYRPRDVFNFLVGWRRPHGHEGPGPAEGEERQPVVWVSLAEARAYCSWAGKRLPHIYEWQLAAQGTDGRVFPWGNTTAEAASFSSPSSCRRPSPVRGGASAPPLPAVGACSPAGDSPFGVADLVGFVWQYTDEFQDEHTRTVLVKGSSMYEPMISGDFPALQQVGNWYFPRAPQVDRHNRMMLMDDSYERAGTLGFRCAADHTAGQSGPLHFRDLEASAAPAPQAREPPSVEVPVHV